MLSVISFSCCKILNLGEATRQELTRIILMPFKLSTYSKSFLDKQNSHVHLVRSRFGLFLWKAAQHDGSDGPLKETRRIGHADN